MAATLRASKQGLEIVDQGRRKKGWTAIATMWCGTANTSAATLKRFRRGLPVQQDAFIGICQAVGIINWEEIVDDSPAQKTSALISCFAYDDNWVGREELIAQLSAKVQQECRVLVLTGITGIGKTALAERLAVELQGKWKKFDRVNFDDQEKMPDFSSVASELLSRWGEAVTPDDRKDTQRLLYRLVKHFRENRYLLLIDSLEFILEGNEEEGWSDFKDEWWLRFFQNLLTAEACQSCLILTSQDLPRQLEETGSRYPNYWYCQPLSGLTANEQLDLFDQTGLDTETESLVKRYLVRIGNAYEGHPLALRVIAGEIGDKPFYGNVEAYWNQYGNEIEEVEKALEEAQTQAASADDNWQLHRYTRSLRKRVRSRLEKTFNRLKNDVYYAYVLLCEASIYRCAVKETWWLSHLEDWDLPEDWDDDKSQQMLDTLRDRYLVEEEVTNNKLLLRQHNLIRSVALEHLKKLG